MALPPLTAARWFTGWSFDLAPVLLAIALGLAYLGVARRVPDWPRTRSAWFVAGGVGSLLVVTQSFLGTYDTTRFWPLAVQDVLLLTLVPIGFTLGRPLELWHTLRPRRREQGLLLKVLTFPLVGSVLAVGVLLAIYTTGWDPSRLDSPALLFGTQVLLLVLGCTFLWPLLGVDAGTGHTSYPVRVIIAFIDGLLDAIPGLAILGTGHVIAASHYHSTSTHDQQLGGTAMVGLAELVGLPALVVLLVQWMRSDDRQAATMDAQAELAELAGLADQVSSDRPWWETDPGPLGDRFRT